MKSITGFIKLIRWPNLVFIALVQILFQYCVIIPFSETSGIPVVLNHQNFIYICLSVVLMAAGGYIINDYFDLNIDKINKPEKVIIERVISRRYAIFWHAFLSLIAIALTALAAKHTGKWWVIIANAVVILALWQYSTTYKKSTLIGNVLVSVITAWSIVIIYFMNNPDNISEVNTRIFTVGAIYSGFAFVISLIREVIKDMEDVDGDRKYGCKTMPIAWGINASKIFVGVWLAVSIISIAVIQFYIIVRGWYLVAAYCIIFILIPLIYLIKLLSKAQVSKDYHKLSTNVKLIMLAGILSMCFFLFYN